MDNQATPPAAPLEEAPDLSAGFWLRGGAYMIDGLLVAIVSIVLNLILPETVSVIARILLSAGYFTIMPVHYEGRTLGKMAAGVAIVRDDGSPLTYGRAFARWLGYLVSGLTFCLGFVCAAFTNRKRALHDYIADTRVVRVQEIGGGRKLAVVLTGILFPLLVAAGLVAALAIPKFAGLQNLASEGAAKGRLAGLRTAAALYYGDMQGKYPADLGALVPKYIPALDPPGIPEGPAAAGVETYGPEVCSGSKEPGQALVADKLRDTGKWGYVAAPGAPCDGTIFIDSKLQDSKGSAWYTY
ncbi:MAG TPA: RDD family protein [Elusimicrobiota bacterium]|jgi:uncharacterized RDD family membrane protein YckC|nr:RDD family protein [Elusimicrobiota bacterium]